MNLEPDPGDVQPRRRYVPGTRIDDGSRVRVYSGHAKTKGVKGQCALCLKRGPLRLSHITPAWAIRQVGKPLMPTAERGQVEFQDYDDHKEYLLCPGCEQHLGASEKYLAALTRGEAQTLARIGVQLTDGFVLHRVRRPLVLRAICGLVFKTHLSEAGVYEHKTLPNRLASRLRQRILSDDYPDEFKVYAAKWMDFGGAFPPRDVCYIAFYETPNGFFAALELGGVFFLLRFKGWTPYYEASSHAPLTANRPWEWGVTDIRASGWRAQKMKISVDQAVQIPDQRPLTAETPCPCGAPNAAYRDCCLGRWVDTDKLPAAIIDPSHVCPQAHDPSVCQGVVLGWRDAPRSHKEPAWLREHKKRWQAEVSERDQRL